MTQIRFTSAHHTSAASGLSSRRERQSWNGASLARARLLAQGLMEQSPDDMKVTPLAPGSALWNYTQPLLSSGGHIVGVPASSTCLHDAIQMGLRTLAGLLEGKRYMANKPEYALPVLLVLWHSMEESSHSDDASMHDGAAQLQAACPYSAESPLADAPASTNFQETLLNERIFYSEIVEFLKGQDLHEDHHEACAAAPHWKEIKAAFPPSVSCSNKMARFVRRIMVTKFPRMCAKQRIALLREFILSPVFVPSTHPVVQFIEQCWSLRGSSISVSLPKKPPAVVYDILRAHGLLGRSHGGGSSLTSHDLPALRATLAARFDAFGEWARRLHSGGDPRVWSDTLSKFASQVNPTIDRYNNHQERHHDDRNHHPLMCVTSFVPADLSPEMYYWSGPTRSGYFFHGHGMYYCYSANWRRDAVRAWLGGWLRHPVTTALQGTSVADWERVGITPAVAYQGGHELLHKLATVGVSETVMTKFLRDYYWSGAFLDVNKKILGQD